MALSKPKDAKDFKNDVLDELKDNFGVELDDASKLNKYLAIGNVIRKYSNEDIIKTNNMYKRNKTKQVYYFSMEFLLGKLLESNLINLGLLDIFKEALKDLNIYYEDIIDMENDQGLGNGGLGRLAACFLDSLASLDIAGHGCGIRYKYGFFKQKIIDGHQVELSDNWLSTGGIWELRKEDKAVEVRFGGTIKEVWQEDGLKITHENCDTVLAVPYDTPIIGFQNNTVNTLRLWSAEAKQKELDFTLFSRGEYLKAVEEKYNVETISQILYPNSDIEEGRVLRLKQQYFFVSAGIQSIIRRYKKLYGNLSYFDVHIAIQINDTHPALVIPELMRILIDEEGLSWNKAWGITTRTVSYTNHTILPEAMEKWSIDMFRTLMPRIYTIVNEINERFCKELWIKYEGDWDRISRMAIISDGYVKMAHLAVVGSKTVNGVAKIHSEILKRQVMSDFYNYYPYKFCNKTNGVTHRRWLLLSNPELSGLISQSIGDRWIYHPTDLSRLECFCKDNNFLEKLADIKRKNKLALIDRLKDSCDLNIDPDSIFDVHVKRIHAYKRQLLNIMNVMDLYYRLLDNPELDIIPRTFIFAGKAAPSYRLAKQTIKLINTVADMINNDKTIKDKIKVVFIEDYKVSIAERIIPAADVSEQISTTTKEASGTGNMKFMMNGAITIATLDGANVEIRDAVGDENIVAFGLTEKEVMEYYIYGGYNSIEYYNSDSRIRRVIDGISNSDIKRKEEFSAIVDSLLIGNDEYFVLKDFDSYVKAQNRIDELYRDNIEWHKKALINIANSGIFSSDRTIIEYANEIWGVKADYRV
ncbi:MAG: glycogen/starch/alpha-glucan phosphorylase [Firmicutes bacterium]|nr:glycogen/starch/alpha-glucan phosphorylase [Bacillota bacterium]